MSNVDLTISLKEYMREVKSDMEKGFAKQDLRFDKIDEKFESLEKKYAQKSSVNRIWVIIWSIISFGAVYYGKMLFDLLTKYIP